MGLLFRELRMQRMTEQAERDRLWPPKPLTPKEEVIRGLLYPIHFPNPEGVCIHCKWRLDGRLKYRYSPLGYQVDAATSTKCMPELDERDIVKFYEHVPIELHDHGIVAQLGL